MVSQRPDVAHVQIFGCLVQLSVTDHASKILSRKPPSSVHIEHVTANTSRSFGLKTRKVALARHGCFEKSVFPRYYTQRMIDEQSTAESSNDQEGCELSW